MKKIKPGYYILLAIALFFAYKYFFDNSKEVNYYTKEVNSILTDIKHQDYFALHSKLTQNLKHTVSVDDIKEYIDNIKLNNKYKFIFKDYKKITKKEVKIRGTVISNTKELPLEIIVQDNNGTLEISEEKIGTNIIKSKDLPFPFVIANSNNSTKN